MESLLTIALAGMDDTYDDIVSYDKSKGIYYMSANEIAKSLQKEENIYETPYKHKEDCGPVYCVPADDEKNIYEEFAGKKFRKLLHKEIKLVFLHYNFIHRTLRGRDQRKRCTLNFIKYTLSRPTASSTTKSALFVQ